MLSDTFLLLSELLARASHYEAAAEALTAKRELEMRCVAPAVEQRSKRQVVSTRDELASSQAALRSSSERISQLEAEVQLRTQLASLSCCSEFSSWSLICEADL